MKKYTREIKWGLIFSVVALLWTALEKAMGWHGEAIGKQAVYTNFFALLAVLIYVFALLDKKKNDYQGQMSWKQGFVSGIIISAVVAILSPLTQYLAHTFISPEYFDNVKAYVISEGKMSADQAEGYFNLKSYIIQSAFGALTMGTVTAAIVAVFVKSK